MKPLPKTKLKKSIKYSEAYKIGNHILACADAKDSELIKRIIGKAKIHAVIVDPPYSIKVVESKIGFSKIKVPKKILNDDIASEADYAKFTNDWLKAILPHLASKNSFYIFNADPMIFALREGMRQAGVKFSQLLIWLKSQSVIGRKDYLPGHELVAFGWYGSHIFYKAKDKSLIFCPKPHVSPLHPTQKPVGLIRHLILNSTKIGDTVYDCFAGSGTIGIAAEQTKRLSIMIERDEQYCETIIKRMENAFGFKAKPIKI